jgi:ABC-type nitrate/sulfonate/bicarbonate transport system permease component
VTTSGLRASEDTAGGSGGAPVAAVVDVPRPARHWRTTRRTAERLVGGVASLALVLSWEFLSRYELIDTRFFPPPSTVVMELVQMSTTGELWHDIGATMKRVALGFVIGAVPGVLLGLAMGLNRWVRVALNPIVAATYPLPKTALLPLLLLIFGIGETSKIALLTIGVFFPVLINTLTGVLQIKSIYFDVGTNFGASRRRLVKTIAIPGALPTIIAGLRLGAGLALILVYVAEMVGADGGIGYMMWNAWNLFAVERMYVGLFVIAILGLLISILFDVTERKLVPWQVTR